MRLFYQIIMRAGLDNSTLCHADDHVAIANGSQPMGDDKNGSVLHDLPHVMLDDAFALVIERRGRLVKNQDRRVGCKRAGDGDALALAAG